jgi:hypothetical protein
MHLLKRSVFQVCTTIILHIKKYILNENLF